MKIKLVVFVFAVCLTTTAISQKFEGIATYKTDINIPDSEKKVEGVDDVVMKQVMEQMKSPK